MIIILLLRFSKSCNQLQETRYENAQGEAYGIIYRLLITMEEIDKLAIALRKKVGQDISHRVVDPMQQDAWHKATGAIVHPS